MRQTAALSRTTVYIGIKTTLLMTQLLAYCQKPTKECWVPRFHCVWFEEGQEKIFSLTESRTHEHWIGEAIIETEGLNHSPTEPTWLNDTIGLAYFRQIQTLPKYFILKSFIKIEPFHPHQISLLLVLISVTKSILKGKISSPFSTFYDDNKKNFILLKKKFLIKRTYCKAQ